MPNYRRVSYEDRCKISVFLQVKYSKSMIARELGFHKSTVYREISRNNWNGYSPQNAQNIAREQFKRCRKRIKVQGDLEQVILIKLARGWSPEQIAGRLKRERFANISHETIYRYLQNNRRYRVYLRFYNKRGGGRYIYRKYRAKMRLHTIHDRPQIANNRMRIGDWERDTMYAANRKCLLVCSDRKTRFTKIQKVKKFTSEGVSIQTKELLSSTGKKVFTVTNDNGSEFRCSEKLAIPVFYCDPLRPQQRGTVENTIGLIRQYIKRKTDIDLMEENDIKYIEDLINYRPRKILGFLTPYEQFFNKRVALAI